MDAWTPLFSIVVAILATWRVTHLLTAEDGPLDAILRLRAMLGTSQAGKMMDCFQCLSLWVAAPFTFMVTHSLWAWVPVWLAISGAAGLLERLGREPPEWKLQPPDFPENHDHDVLRPRQDDSAE